MSNQTESKSRYQSESFCQGLVETNIIYRHLMWQEVNKKLTNWSDLWIWNECIDREAKIFTIFEVVQRNWWINDEKMDKWCVCLRKLLFGYSVQMKYVDF